MPDRLYVDVSSLEDLARKLKRAAHDSKPEVQKELLLIGEEHAKLAKTLVSGHSKSIPPTIHVRPLPDAVELTAGGDAAPLAGLYEFGNHKGRGFDSKRTRQAYTAHGLVTEKAFKHPVFGNRGVWVSQSRFPFFRVARARLARETIKRLVAAWDRALEHNGIKAE